MALTELRDKFKTEYAKEVFDDFPLDIQLESNRTGELIVRPFGERDDGFGDYFNDAYDEICESDHYENMGMLAIWLMTLRETDKSPNFIIPFLYRMNFVELYKVNLARIIQEIMSLFYDDCKVLDIYADEYHQTTIDACEFLIPQTIVEYKPTIFELVYIQWGLYNDGYLSYKYEKFKKTIAEKIPEIPLNRISLDNLRKEINIGITTPYFKSVF